MNRRTCRLLGAAFSALTLIAIPTLAQSVYTPYTFATLAGNAGYGSADGTGADARFNAPFGAAVDSAGNVYVADTFNNTIRKVTAGGGVTKQEGRARGAGRAGGEGGGGRATPPYG